jgi:hypothetical protein
MVAWQNKWNPSLGSGLKMIQVQVHVPFFSKCKQIQNFEFEFGFFLVNI